MLTSPVQPAPQGLYDGRHEHDACGVAFVATLTGRASHDIVDLALTALRNLEHRGASGAEPDSGDGAGILVQVPDAFLRQAVGFPLPPAGRYAVGIAFLPVDAAQRAATQQAIEAIAASEAVEVLGWREVPVDPALVGATARSVMPAFWQLFVAHGKEAGIDLDRRAYPLRKRVEHELGVYFASLSSRTLVYKGMLTTGQLEPFYPDLSDPRLASALALVHSRFSTNTFPSWPLAHPYRYISHNGEINTVRGNRNWMQAREAMITSDVIPGDVTRLFPICTPGGSDSASFDEVLELLHLGGRSLPHSVLMMIPEAWENNPGMDPARRAFYEYHSTFMEPWDGPANVCFSDGTQIGAVLDRNGLRPGRFWVTDDGLVVLASEAGVLDIDPATIVRKGRLQPGLMFLVDTAAGRIIEDDEIKAQLAAEEPYADWLHAGLIHLDALPEREHIVHTPQSVARRQQTFGYTEEELRVILEPMARTGGEPLGSMGTDTPIAVLSSRPRMIFDYFSQLFAQVTNPPLDAIREEIVTSLSSIIGPEGNVLEPTPAHCRQVVLPFPVIDNDELSKVLHINQDGDQPGFAGVRLRGLYPVAGGGDALEHRLGEIFHEVDAVIRQGKRFIVLSDRDSDAQNAPIPSLLLCAAVHHHLVRTKSRTMVGLLIEAGDVREVHHVALLIGYGAAAVNPYLALESVEDLVRRGAIADVTPEKAMRNIVKSLGKGVLKVMSKMGVSTVASYRGAQIFEAVGLSQGLVDAHFTGTSSRLGGVGLDVIAEEVALRHRVAYPVSGIPLAHRRLDVGGEYQWRREGEPHLFDPDTVFRLQHATRTRRYDIFREYTGRIDEQSERLMTLRGLFRLKVGERPPVALAEVEPIDSIVRRFSTGAMSYGSISQEAHETLAIAMNRMGAKSNTGEGGEDPERFVPLPNGDSRRSAIKQVASGRFGVTSEYLVNSDDIQIKMAQGAKPGEGGQLPGHKVYPWIARTRHSTPGVGLISPPPHHDIYSIEDLAQLIHDLKNANPQARVHVKLVSEVGVGTVAAGVAKAHADVILISGHDGGTGASPLTSLKHAGAPWELGLAETQQTLILNDLRDRVVVQTDGQLKTGRDVVIAALLGAEEFGFATAPLVVMGCVMMRVCHLDTCPVGVATQNPVLRERFTGRPEFVETFFEFIATEVRELLAALGLRSLDEAIGHAELIDATRAVGHWKASGLDLDPILHVPAGRADAPRRHMVEQDHGLDRALDRELIALCQPALESGEPVRASLPIRNVNRTVGTMLGSEVTRLHGGEGLPDGTIDLTFVGSAGQSFGAFLPTGITLRLEGDANDYVGKGLSGGRIA
ncbi:MAG: glutamate synthase large subunit, partial [Candidatus Nanopelagicales bacterium]